MDNQKIWNQVLELLKLNVNEISYKTWLAPVRIYHIDNALKIVYLESPKDQPFADSVLKQRYAPQLESLFEEVMNEPYHVVIKKPEEYEEESKKKTQIQETLTQQRIFNPNFRFDNFVVGDCNKIAHAAALAVAEAPSQAYNPLFIYGGSGLGKTHLMHAIGIHLLENNDNINVLYVSSEMFTNELIRAINENTMGAFKAKYRKVDVLLIDDIQFLEGKEKTQEEFFHTFNTLYDENRQIVISSDRPPNKLTNLEERLRSRFAWRIIVDIQPADYETRVAILLKKLDDMNITLNDDLYEVICIIAEKVTNNNRELEGALTSLVTFSRLLGEPIDRNFARKYLKDIIQNGVGENVTPEKIKKTVCRHFGIDVRDMESAKRSSQIAYPRQIAMYLCRSMTEYSYEKIGQVFGNRHYSTVMHACEKIQKDLRDDKELSKELEEIKQSVRD